MLLGREVELATIRSVAQRARQGTGATVEIVGPPGIGKTVLADEVEIILASEGFTVARHTSTHPERLLSWAALVAMTAQLEPFIGSLSTGSARYLAMVTAPDPDMVIEPHGVALAFADLVKAAAAQGPLGLVIDDSQWLDDATTAALAFATRWWTDVPVMLLITRRGDDSPKIPAPTGADWTTIDLGGLDIDGIATLTREVGVRLTGLQLRQLFERSGGNPLLARRVAQRVADGVDVAEALRSQSLSDTLAAALAALAGPTRRCLEVAALIDRPTLADLAAATGADELAVLVLLSPAERAGMVTIDGTAVNFVHPQIADAVVEQMSTAERRSTHAVLASMTDDVERRGTHLAESVPTPSAQAAADIEAAARLATRRGAFDRSVQLHAASVAATPADDTADTRRRLIALVGAQSDAGDYDAVLATVARLDPQPRSAEMADLLPMLVRATGELVGLDALRAVLGDAAAWVQEPALLGRVFCNRTITERLANLRLGLAAAGESLDAARRHGDHQWLVRATIAEAACRAVVGEPVDVDAVLGLYPLADDGWPGYTVSELQQLLWFTGDSRGMAWSAAAIESAGDGVPLPVQWNRLSMHGKICAGRGCWAEAEAALRHSLRFNEEDDSERVDLAYVLATTGRIDAARALLAENSRVSLTRGRTGEFQVAARRAMLAWTLQQPDAADRLVVAEEIGAEIGLRAVRPIPFRRDLVEALVAAGRLDEADAATTRLGDDAERCDSDAARADAAAAEAVVASARGDHPHATESITRACKMHERDGLIYEHARSLLAAGRIARRSGRRADARQALNEASELFTAMAAAPWIERCAEELARLGGRAPSGDALTSSERQVAERAAAGQSNAAIAAELVVSLRTVEAHLSRVYRKLGIRSRAGLAGALASASP